MTLRFGSFCSGIGAPEVAWSRLGWAPQFFSEIEPFPCAVMAHHFPGVPNLGDMTKITNETLSTLTVDAICAGTPCQSFSVAGLRGGMTDARGNLALVFCRLVDAIRPRWVVWENVPGVLSSNGGRDLGSFLVALGQLGYGWAFRVLDARNFGVPLSRRRVFVVGSFGDWRRAAAVLFAETAFDWSGETGEGGRPPERANNITTRGCRAGCGEAYVAERRGLRTFTPREREMLMGFPIGHTDITGETDEKRIRAIGNSMVVPVLHWIGSRIEQVEAIEQEERTA